MAATALAEPVAHISWSFDSATPPDRLAHSAPGTRPEPKESRTSASFATVHAARSGCRRRRRRSRLRLRAKHVVLLPRDIPKHPAQILQDLSHLRESCRVDPHKVDDFVEDFSVLSMAAFRCRAGSLLQVF